MPTKLKLSCGSSTFALEGRSGSFDTRKKLLLKEVRPGPERGDSFKRESCELEKRSDPPQQGAVANSDIKRF